MFRNILAFAKGSQRNSLALKQLAHNPLATLRYSAKHSICRFIIALARNKQHQRSDIMCDLNGNGKLDAFDMFMAKVIIEEDVENEEDKYKDDEDEDEEENII